MSLEDDLKDRVAEIFADGWDTRNGYVVPDPEDVGHGNVGVKLDAAVLYADLKGSTKMVDAESREFSAEIYKSYLFCAGEIIQENDGVITAYDGDRIMAVFIGDRKRSNAAGCALKICHAVRHIINPAIVSQYGANQYTVKQIVGVDCGNLTVARTGVRGNNDLVWVGPAANYAAKLCDLGAAGHSSYITSRVFDPMKSYKTYRGRSIWEERTWNDMRIYRSNWAWEV